MKMRTRKPEQAKRSKTRKTGNVPGAVAGDIGRRLLSIAMSVVLVVGLMPLPAFAQAGDLVGVQADLGEGAETSETIDVSEGVLQAGGFIQEAPKQENTGFMLGAQSVADVEGFEAALSAAAEAWDGKAESVEVDVSTFGIPNEQARVRVGSFLNKNGQFFYLKPQFNIGTNGSSDTLSSVELRFQTSITADDISAFHAAADNALSEIEEGWSDEQKALYLHDWLVTHCECDLTYSRYSAYDALVVGSAVCQGYSLAYDYLLGRAGVECDVISSDGIDHAWNLVTVDGATYYVDCTWDDPSNVGYEAYCKHEYFLNSKSAFGHTGDNNANPVTDWLDTTGTGVYDSTTDASSTAYDSAYWADATTQIPHVGDLWAYVKSGESGTQGTASVYVHDYASDADCVLASGIPGVWGDWDEMNGYWPVHYTSLVSNGESFAASIPTGAVKITADGAVETAYELTTEEAALGYVYGLLYDGSNMECRYQLGVQIAEAPTGSGAFAFAPASDPEPAIATNLEGDTFEIPAGDENIASGTSGTCTWEIDANGTLTIHPTSGDEGVLGVWSYAGMPEGVPGRPWEPLRKHIVSVKIVGDVKAQTCDRMFQGCGNLTSVDLSGLDTTDVTEMAEMFEGCQSLTSLDLSSLDTTNARWMDGMFNQCSSLASLNVSNFNTSNVATMNGMFEWCCRLTDIDVSSFDTSNVTSMHGMFDGCLSLESIDLANFNTSRVAFMDAMFRNCTSITALDLSGFNTPAATRMDDMFAGCSSLFKLDISGFDTNNVPYDVCIGVSEAGPVNTDGMSGMFSDCLSLKALALGRAIGLRPECALPEGAWVLEDGGASFETTDEFIAGYDGNTMAGTWIRDDAIYVDAPNFDQLESGHYYANNTDKSWVYSDEDAAYGMAVTFSDETETEASYDTIEIYGADDENPIGSYSGKQLAGKTVYVPNTTSLRIRLVSDGSVSQYGFRVTNMRALEASEAMVSLSFTPANPYRLIEPIDGWIDEDKYGDEYFRYKVPSLQEGDTLTIAMADGSSTEYVYGFDEDYEEWRFVSDSGEAIGASDIAIQYVDYQSAKSAWRPDETHKLFVTYMGRTAEVDVDIVENPVISITYAPRWNYQLYELVDGFWSNVYSWDEEIDEAQPTGEKWFRYELPGPLEGDVLTVRGADGETEYTYASTDSSGGKGFVSEAGVVLDGVGWYFGYDQSADAPWRLGEVHKVTIDYMGRTTEIDVPIVENPVTSISYTAANDFRLMELVDGSWQFDDGGDRYFGYTSFNPALGDSITVVASESTTDYVYGYVEEREEDCFVSAAGEVLEGVDWRYVDVQSAANQWQPGTVYKVAVTYMGRTAEVDVRVVENPVKQISYRPANPYRLMEAIDGYWAHVYDENGEPTGAKWFHYETPDICVGDVLTLFGADGAGTDYVFGYDGRFTSTLGDALSVGEVDFRFADDQSVDNQWQPGETHKLVVTYMGHTAEIEVPIVENPVKQISYRPANPYRLMEAIDGYWAHVYDENGEPTGEKWFRYVSPGLREGDVLTLFDADKEATEYTYAYNSEADEWQLTSDSGAQIDTSELSFRFVVDDQSSTAQWQPGDKRQLAVTYMDRTAELEVEIVANPVASIAFASADGLKMVEQVDGHWEFDDNGEDFFYYNENAADMNEGDVLTVVCTDGVSTAYTCRFDEGSSTKRLVSDAGDTIDFDALSFEALDNQFTAHWQLGEEHMLRMSYMGRTCEIPVTIVAKPLVSIAAITLDAESAAYTGSALAPTVTVKDADGAAVPESGYDLTWSGALTDVGTYTVTATGKGDYEGTASATFKVEPASIEGAAVALTQASFTYDGKPKEPVVTAIGGKALVAETDFDAVYSDNTEAGTATVYITGKGNYVGNASATFAISPASIEGALLVLSKTRFTYNGQVQRPAVAAIGGKRLEAGVDYTLACSAANPVNAGSYEAWVVGKGNYAGTSAKAGFTISPVSIEGAAVALAQEEFDYDGAAHEPAVTAIDGKALVAGTDFDAVYFDNVDAGEATVTVIGKGNYMGSVTTTFTIEPASISGAKLGLSNTDFVYTGKVLKPTVTTVDGEKLELGKDYTLKYSNASSKKPGTYRVWAIGKGNYEGASAKASYAIAKLANPVKVKALAPSVKLSKVKKTKQVLAASRAFKVSGNKGGKATYKKVSGDKKVAVSKVGKVTVAKGTKKGTHTVKVQVVFAAKGSYDKATKTVTLKVKVK